MSPWHRLESARHSNFWIVCYSFLCLWNLVL